MTAALAEAAKTFEQTLGELGITGKEREVDPSALGRRAALLAASDVVWHKHLGPMYSSKQVREVMGRGTRQSMSELAKRGRLIALPEEDGRLAFPAFQFGRTGKRLPALERILEIFNGAVETPYTVASWFVTPERSEEHTSELQSLTNLVCRLLLEKKKKQITTYNEHTT